MVLNICQWPHVLSTFKVVLTSAANCLGEKSEEFPMGDSPWPVAEVQNNTMMDGPKQNDRTKYIDLVILIIINNIIIHFYYLNLLSSSLS